MAGTDLILSAPGVLPAPLVLAARHELRLIRRGALYRDVNGTGRRAAPLDAAPDRFALSAEIRGDAALPLTALDPLSALLAIPAAAMSHMAASGADSVTLIRDPAGGSVTARHAETGAAHEVLSVDGRTVTVAAHPDAAVLVIYRPVLSMHLDDYRQGFDELAGDYLTRLNLVEV